MPALQAFHIIHILCIRGLALGGNGNIVVAGHGEAIQQVYRDRLVVMGKEGDVLDRRQGTFLADQTGFPFPGRLPGHGNLKARIVAKAHFHLFTLLDTLLAMVAGQTLTITQQGDTARQPGKRAGIVPLPHQQYCGLLPQVTFPAQGYR